MALRLYVNAFKAADTRVLVSRNMGTVLQAAQGSGSFGNQQVSIKSGLALAHVC